MALPRILHLFSTFDHGGSEARMVRLVNHFAGELSHTVVVGNRAAMRARDAIAPDLAVTFPEHGAGLLSGRPGPLRFHRLARLMRGHDLVLTYGWGAMDAVMAHRLLARPLRLPPLIHHEDGFNEDEAAGQKPARRRYRRLAMQRLAALVVPSRTLEDIALRDWHIPPARLARIGIGINLAAFGQAGEGRIGAGQSETAGGITVGTVAGLRTVKNLPRLVRAAAGAGPDVRLTIIGEGPERAVIEAEAARLGMTDRLFLSGFMAEPAAALARCDIFALSSDSEQFPTALIEAMAAGLPVASVDVGDIRHMVAEENRRFVVAPHDEAALAAAIAALAADGDLRRRLGAANAARAAAEFGEARMFAKYRTLYSHVLNHRQFGPAAAG